MRVALVNTNRIQPPIAPIGLDYVAEALNTAGHQVQVLDLCWARNVESAISSFFGQCEFDLVGVTLRNTDDCAFTSRQSFIDDFSFVVKTIRRHTGARIVAGGVGFSVMAESILSLCPVDAGIWADGEFALVELARRLEEKRDWLDLPGLIYPGGGQWERNPPCRLPLSQLPPMTRRWMDNRRYFRAGGQMGFETKRGCPCRCIYCADPVAKGREIRLRSPQAVVDELENLLGEGIDHFHTCDSEFNMPPGHALEICKEIIRRRLGNRLRWYAYCAPAPFPPELARAMAQAGCAGINFGVDHGDEEMLQSLGRDFKPQDIVKASAFCREQGMAVMLDLLLGSPGETEESLRRTIDLMKEAEPDQVGIALGVRVYPGTELSRRVKQVSHGLIGGEDPSRPLFFLEPAVASSAAEVLDRLIGDDRRFLFFDPSRPKRNYNYNANQRLVEAIAKGYRGAYWDILRRYE